jgi:hypothetical protein
MASASKQRWFGNRVLVSASRRLRVAGAGLAACLLVGMLLSVTVRAQTPRPVSPGLPTLPSGAPANSRQDYDIPSSDPSEEQRRLLALMVARRKRVVSDSNKLLKLTMELNAEVARTNPDALSPAQLHKLAAIEKLAHDLKDKLRSTAQPSTGIQVDPRLRP